MQRRKKGHFLVQKSHFLGIVCAFVCHDPSYRLSIANVAFKGNYVSLLWATTQKRGQIHHVALTHYTHTRTMHQFIQSKHWASHCNDTMSNITRICSTFPVSLTKGFTEGFQTAVCVQEVFISFWKCPETHWGKPLNIPPPGLATSWNVPSDACPWCFCLSCQLSDPSLTQHWPPAGIWLKPLCWNGALWDTRACHLRQKRE